MPEITTTLAKIIAHEPCEDSWELALDALGGYEEYGPDTPITFRRIVEIVGLEYAIWCLRSVPEHASLWRHFAVDCAERVRHLMTDPRSIAALRVARLAALGTAGISELKTAVSYACDASTVAAARPAFYAARAAYYATCAVCYDDCDDYTDYTAQASRRATCHAACDAIYSEELAWQASRLIALCEAGEWSPMNNVNEDQK